MSEHGQAWVLILCLAMLGGCVLYYLLRGIEKRYVRVVIAALTVTFFAVPAPVPGYESQISPAFIVLIFETFFQIDGKPEASLRILGLSMLLVIILVGFGHWIFQRYGKRQVSTEQTD